jgi:3-deoxy-D-glycero-D-galacto-nononate 9-phosphatase
VKKIKIFFTDIDGVWTDGGMYYDQNQNELKKFNTSDSVGVLFLKQLKIPLIIITGENTSIVKKRAEKLKINQVYLGVENKLKVAEKIILEMKIKWSEVAFIGDEINDIALLKRVGLSACPNNAPNYTKSVVDWVSPIKGGDGAFKSFVEYYLISQNLLEESIENYLKNH